VDKEDYAKNEKKEIIEHLVELSKYGLGGLILR
jgi:hypothetical protein